MLQNIHKIFLPAILLSLPIILSLAISGCKTEQIQCHWPSQPIIIDGQMTEWEDRANIYFEENGVLLGLRNDDENLYILFRFRDRSWLRAIRMTGLTIWLDGQGNKDKTFGIRYNGIPLPDDSSFTGVGGQNINTANMPPGMMERMAERLRDMPVQLTVIDENRWYEPMAVPEDGSRGPAVAFSDARGFYTYEFSIPLAESTDDTYGLNSAPGQIIGIGGEWGDMDMDDLKPSRGNMSGGRGDGMGGGRGGGMGGGKGGGMGGRPGGMGGNRLEMPEKQEFWLKTELAVSPADPTENTESKK